VATQSGQENGKRMFLTSSCHYSFPPRLAQCVRRPPFSVFGWVCAGCITPGILEQAMEPDGKRPQFAENGLETCFRSSTLS
jgi:hypothetical protein